MGAAGNVEGLRGANAPLDGERIEHLPAQHGIQMDSGGLDLVAHVLVFGPGDDVGIELRGTFAVALDNIAKKDEEPPFVLAVRLYHPRHTPRSGVPIDEASMLGVLGARELADPDGAQPLDLPFLQR